MKIRHNIELNFEKDYNEASKLCREIMRIHNKTCCERCIIAQQIGADIKCSYLRDYAQSRNKKINYV